MTTTISKANLCEASKQIVEAMLNGLPAPSDCQHEFSDTFEAKMVQVRHQAHRRECVKKSWQKVAIVILALLLTASTWLSVDVQAREKIFAWIREEIQSSTIYRFFCSESEYTLPNYEMTWLPDGFELFEHERELNNAWDYVFYTNPTTGKSIVFTCYRLNDMPALTLSGEGSEMENRQIVDINGMKGDYYADPSDTPTNNLLWVNEDYSVLMTIDSDLQKDVILHIAKDVFLSEPTKSK